MASPQSQASFSSLPPEIRNRIYRYLIPSDQLVTPTLKVTRRQRGDLPGCFLPTSKGFTAEAAPSLYSSNHFSFKIVYDGVLFLKRIGNINRTHVKEMSFGTFWLDKDQAHELGIEYEGAQYMVMDWIATNFPSLHFLSFGGLAPCGRNWQVKTLGKLKYLIGRLPDLDTVLYSKRVKRMVLSAGAIDETLEERDGYSAFDVHDLIEKTTVKPKAVIRPKAKTTVTVSKWYGVQRSVERKKMIAVDEAPSVEATISNKEVLRANKAASAEAARVAKDTGRANGIDKVEAKPTPTKLSELIAEDARKRLAAAFLRNPDW